MARSDCVQVVWSVDPNDCPAWVFRESDALVFIVIFPLRSAAADLPLFRVEVCRRDDPRRVSACVAGRVCRC